MKFEDEVLLLARGIDSLIKEAKVDSPNKPAGSVIDILKRRENLIQCLQEAIFAHHGERTSDDPQVPHNPDDGINQWGN